MNNIYLIPTNRINTRELVIEFANLSKVKFNNETCLWDFQNVEYISRSAAQQVNEILMDNKNRIAIINKSEEVSKMLTLIKKTRSDRINRLRENIKPSFINVTIANV